MTDENIVEHNKDDWEKEQALARKENDDIHKVEGEDTPIKEKEYISECQKCGQPLFLNAKALDYETRETFGCGYQVIKLNGKYLCKDCLVTVLWNEGKERIKLGGLMEDTKQELILKEQGQELAKILTPEVIKKYICPSATTQEIFMFLQIAKMYQLNPFKREIYLVKYGDNPAQNVVGYEVYLKRAERTGNWSGMKVWTEGEVPTLIAKIEISRKGWDKPFYHEVEYSEYVQHKKDGSVTKFWKEKPKTMLKKVVVSQAFRMAFPDEFGGMPYTMEEMPIEIEKLPINEVKVDDTLNIPEDVIEQTLEKEKERVTEELKNNIETPLCEKCNKTLTPKVYNYSKDKFGKALCFDCQKG